MTVKRPSVSFDDLPASSGGGGSIGNATRPCYKEVVVQGFPTNLSFEGNVRLDTAPIPGILKADSHFECVGLRLVIPVNQSSQTTNVESVTVTFKDQVNDEIYFQITVYAEDNPNPPSGRKFRKNQAGNSNVYFVLNQKWNTYLVNDPQSFNAIAKLVWNNPHSNSHGVVMRVDIAMKPGGPHPNENGLFCYLLMRQIPDPISNAINFNLPSV